MFSEDNNRCVARAWPCSLWARSAPATSRSRSAAGAAPIGQPHQHGRDVVAEPVVVVVVRADGHQHLQLAAFHHLASGRQEIVHASGDRCQQQVVECDAEETLGATEVVHSFTDDEHLCDRIRPDAFSDTCGATGVWESRSKNAEA